MSSRCKFMCGYECCISAKIIHDSLLSWHDRGLKKLRDQIQNSQNRRSGEKANHIYESYKNTVMPHGRHIYAKASDMEKVKMCVYQQSYHSLPHWKGVMRCWVKFSSVNLPEQETYDQHSDTSPEIRFHIYHLIARCSTHGRLPFNKKNICCKCKQDPASE